MSTGRLISSAIAILSFAFATVAPAQQAESVGMLEADASEDTARAVRKMTTTRLILLDIWEQANGRRGLP